MTVQIESGKTILAIGDCNTLGAGELCGNSYPERVGRMLNAAVKNCGFTMSTTREGIDLLCDTVSENHQLVLIQFGLVDAYLTCSFFPYVPYYPDSWRRKFFRNMVKKLNKLTGKLKLRRFLGEDNVVPLDEYEKNIEKMITICQGRQILLIETIPHHEVKRNQHIRRYNTVLDTLAKRHANCQLVRTYDEFAANMNSFYHDKTHANAAGYDFLAGKIIQTVHSLP